MVAADDAGDPVTVLKAAAHLGAGIEDLEPAERDSLVPSTPGPARLPSSADPLGRLSRRPASRRLAVHRALAANLQDDRGGLASGRGHDRARRAGRRGAGQERRTGAGSRRACRCWRRPTNAPPPSARSSQPWSQAGRGGAGRAGRRPTGVRGFAGRTSKPAPHRTRPAGPRGRGVGHGRRPPGRSAHGAVDPRRRRAVPHRRAPDIAGRMLCPSRGKRDRRGSTVIPRPRRRPPTMPRRFRRHAARVPSRGWPRPTSRSGRPRCASSAAKNRSRSLRAAVWAAGLTSMLRDDETALDRALAVEKECRAQGAIGVLPHALLMLADCQLNLGRHREARASGVEGLRIAEDTGRLRIRAHLAAVLARLAAIAGEEERHAELTMITQAVDLPDLGPRPPGSWPCWISASAATTWPPTGSRSMWPRPRAPAADHVEIAVRAGRPEAAGAAFARLVVVAGTSSAAIEAIVSRCRALLADDRTADRHYQRALRLGSAPSNTLALTFITASRCAGHTAASTPARTCDQRGTPSGGSAPLRGPTAPTASYARRARAGHTPLVRRRTC